MKILMTGGSGYIGSLLKQELKDQYEFISVSSKDLDLSKPDMVAAYFDPLDFDVCLHLAAKAQTKICEEQPDYTRLINVDSAIEMAKVCQAKKARMVFFSTEQVFNKQEPAPFKEEDSPKSSTHYGQHKIAVEEYLQGYQDDYLILRLSWQFGLSSKNIKASPNLVKNVINALLYQNPTFFTVNEHRSMTYAYHLVESFPAILSCPKGIVHFASTTDLTTYECALAVAKQLNANQEAISKYILADHKRYQEAPRDYRLDNKKARDLGFSLADFSDDLKQCLEDFDWIKSD